MVLGEGTKKFHGVHAPYFSRLVLSDFKIQVTKLKSFVSLCRSKPIPVISYYQGRSQRGPSPLIEMLFQIFRLNFS